MQGTRKKAKIPSPKKALEEWGEKNLFLRIAGYALEILSCFARSFCSSCFSCIYNETMRNVKALKTKNRYMRNHVEVPVLFAQAWIGWRKKSNLNVLFIKISNQFSFAVGSKLNCGFLFSTSFVPSWNHHKVLWTLRGRAGKFSSYGNWAGNELNLFLVLFCCWAAFDGQVHCRSILVVNYLCVWLFVLLILAVVSSIVLFKKQLKCHLRAKQLKRFSELFS